MNRKVTVIVDLQFGSTGKGLIAGYLALKNKPDTVVCAFGPNAGHTFVTGKKKFIHTMIPNGIVSPALEQILIGPGAVINPFALYKELETASVLGYPDLINKLYIHENAAIVAPNHVLLEDDYQRIGSTSKGTAAAMMEKMERKVEDANIARNLGGSIRRHVVTADEYDSRIDHGNRIQVEGSQGFSLGLNQRFYPYCTSRECSVWQVLADCGIPRNCELEVVGTARTFPIRVANRKEGTSGGWYPDQDEITWASIRQEPELTTVTKLPRRVFTFSDKQFMDAVRYNQPDWIFINFMNYLRPLEQKKFLKRVLNLIGFHNNKIGFLGKGPTDKDVIDVRDYSLNKMLEELKYA